MKLYNFIGIIKGRPSKQKVFASRDAAISYMGKVLERHNLQIDNVYKRDRNHSCEYVCEDNTSRFLISRVVL